MTDPVRQALEAVCDEPTFLRFVQALAADFEADGRAKGGSYAPGTRGWENGTVDSFLERASSWAEESRGKVSGNPWRRCADIVYAGKGYE